MLKTKLYGRFLENYVRAGSQQCSPALLEQLAHSEIDRIRLRVAENPNTPVAVLKLLASDINADVRAAVGTNPTTPRSLIHTLAEDPDPNVRLGLAENLNTSIEILDKLKDDENPYISLRATETKNLVLSAEQAKESGCHRFFKWQTNQNATPELRYA